MAKSPPPITVERLHSVLDYDSCTGIFHWKRTLSVRAPAGAVAGCVHKADGRIYISIDGRHYFAHRLAWFYVHGKWPQAGLDHRDGNRSNNALSNLRPADQFHNMQNLRRSHRDSSTGLLGVQRSGKRYRGVLKVGSIRVFCKSRTSPTEAHADYLEVKRLLHPFATI